MNSSLRIHCALYVKWGNSRKRWLHWGWMVHHIVSGLHVGISRLRCSYFLSDCFFKIHLMLSFAGCINASVLMFFKVTLRKFINQNVARYMT